MKNSSDLSYPDDIANIGVARLAGIAGSDTASQIGGYFTLGPGGDLHTLLPNSSAAILADIETENAPLFVGRVNHVNAFAITQAGGIVSTSTTNSTNFWQVKNAAGTTLFDLDSTNQRGGIGTSTPLANLQVSNSSSNATTTMEVGSSGQNKGSCLKLYRTDGSAIYAYVAAGATTFTLSTTACANVAGF